VIYHLAGVAQEIEDKQYRRFHSDLCKIHGADAFTKMYKRDDFEKWQARTQNDGNILQQMPLVTDKGFCSLLVMLQQVELNISGQAASSL
jgi:hypothetical protein